ncbi:MAG: DNA alkylation repair protein [Bacteroidales bacterium 45-6]|nr:MAG: DNA alkylation repair protein [Bacteroidales bacterium 45-6]
MDNILQRVRETLKSNSDEAVLLSGQRFFKEEIKSYGVKMPVVNKISKQFLPEIKPRGKGQVLELCEELWQSGVIEESFVACEWAHAFQKSYEPSDFETFERWIKNYITNWASCDTLCNHTVGEFLMAYPPFISKLKEFAVSPNRWVRRASSVTLIIPARKGLFLNDIFEIASLLLTDNDDLVQKGYGWMLKAASEAHQQEVFDFVVLNKAAMPRTALRYAIEKMPKEMKAIAMAK